MNACTSLSTHQPSSFTHRPHSSRDADPESEHRPTYLGSIGVQTPRAGGTTVPQEVATDAVGERLSRGRALAEELVIVMDRTM